MTDPIAARILERISRANLVVAPAAIQSAAAYLALLARWNRTINLTGFPLEPPTDEALDRLIVEAFAAAAHLAESDRRVIDVGSGGGSPALPLKMVRQDLELTLIESKSRKAAFLREAARELGLSNVSVEQARLEDLAARGALDECADVVTIRAVRLDAAMRERLSRMARPGGRLLVFSSEGAVQLVPDRQSFLSIVPIL